MSNRRALQAAVLFALVFPTLVTWVYFVALHEQPTWVQQLTFSAGKLLQFSFPVIWLAIRRTPDEAPLRAPANPVPLGQSHGLVTGIAFGVLVSAAMLGLYFYVLKPTGFFEGPAEPIRRKIVGMGLTQTWKYASVGVFYALGHSLLEEYYWRWFVFRQLTYLISTPWAIAVSSLGFMAHHVLILATFFGWASPATWLFSVSIAVGGAVWAWLYQRTQTLLAPWAGHCLVDAAIFTLGFDLARDVMV